MWFSRKSPLLALLGALALVLPGLAGCTFTPVYSDAAATSQRLELVYPEPVDRLSQVILQELAFRLGSTTAEDAPHYSMALNRSVRRVGRTLSGGITIPYEVMLTASITVSRPGEKPEILFQGTRTASAQFEQADQILSNRAAEDDAALRAARALAEIIRLSLLSALAG